MVCVVRVCVCVYVVRVRACVLYFHVYVGKVLVCISDKLRG